MANCPTKSNGGHNLVRTAFENELNTFDFNSPSGCTSKSNCRYEFGEIACVSLAGRRKRHIQLLSRHLRIKEHILRTLIHHVARQKRSAVLQGNFLLAIYFSLYVDMDTDPSRDQATRIAESKNTLLELAGDLETEFTNKDITLVGKVSGYNITDTPFPFAYDNPEDPLFLCNPGSVLNPNTNECGK